jgi:hypothetical protein
MRSNDGPVGIAEPGRMGLSDFTDIMADLGVTNRG